MDFWEKPKEPEIRQVLPMVNGLFYHMNYTFKAGITKSQLDTLFISSYGKRNLAPLIDLIAEKYDLPNDEPLTDAALQELAALVLGMYKIKWDKQGEIPDIEYDPIHNYLHEWEDAEEGSRSTQSSEHRESSYSNDSTNTISNTRTDNLSEVVDRDGSTSTTRTDALSQLETRNLSSSGSGNGANNVYAFDSNSAVGHDTNSNSRSGSDTGTVTTGNTGTQTNAGTEAIDVTTRNTGTQSNSGSERLEEESSHESEKTGTFNESDDRERSGRHTGNIGNITTQKMMKEEIDLWRWNYMRTILEDVCQLLCCDSYLNY